MYGLEFWYKLQELEDELKSNENAYNLLQRLKEKQGTSNEAAIFAATKINKEEVLQKIEEIIIQFLECIANDTLPKFSFNKRGSFSNTTYSNERGMQMVNDVALQEVSLENESSVKKYAVTMSCLQTVYSLIQSGKHATKRDIYYSNVNFFKTQRVVDEAISDISCMLCIPRHSLNVLSSSKGFVGGNLAFKDAEENIVNCNVNEGVQVPCYVDGLNTFESNAKFVLIIEKEAIYKRLLEEKINEKIGPCILITGKGFPDINTRMLVRKLWQELHIPILALVDADPHGIEIMCVYRFGSKALSHEASYLTCPVIRWLGVLPKDVNEVNIKEDQLIKLSDNDRKKANDMIKRTYISSNPAILDQMKLMLEKGFKAEIECFDSISRSFLTDIYLPHKIKNGDWI